MYRYKKIPLLTLKSRVCESGCVYGWNRFRTFGAVTRNIAIANALGAMFMLTFFITGGYIIGKGEYLDCCGMWRKA